MKKSIIIDLFNQEESIAEQILPRTKSYDENMRLKEYFEKKLRQSFTPEQKAIFEELELVSLKVFSEEMEEGFRKGTSLGVRLTAEAFLLEEKDREAEVITCERKDLKGIVEEMDEDTMLCVEWKDDEDE